MDSFLYQGPSIVIYFFQNKLGPNIQTLTTKNWPRMYGQRADMSSTCQSRESKPWWIAGLRVSELFSSESQTTPKTINFFARHMFFSRVVIDMNNSDAMI